MYLSGWLLSRKRERERERQQRDRETDQGKQRQRDKLFKTKLWKTAGGFVALGLSIKYIDHFVENFVIKKLVEPGLDNIEVGKNVLQFGKKNVAVKNSTN